MATKYTDVQIQNLTHRAAACILGKGYKSDIWVKVTPIEQVVPGEVAVTLEACEDDYEFLIKLEAWKEALSLAMKDH